MTDIKLLRLPEVIKKVGLGKTSIYGRVKSGDFPSPVKLGGGRAIAWKILDVEAWINALPTVGHSGREKE